jgi:SPOR domain
MLEGEISQINLIERVVELWREQFTGAIRFENDGIIKIIYFKGGDVLSASTNDRADSIDEILMRAGKVSREHVKQALARRKESETLGDAMLNLGYITRKELTWARRVQVVGVIRSIAAWETGSFTIVADYLPKRDEGTLFPLPQILVELIVTEQDRQKFDRAMEGGSAVFEKSGDFQEVFGRLGLNEDAEAIIAQVDGTRSAADVASSSGRDAFNVYKLLHALATLGILRTTEKPQVTPEFSLDDDFSAAGVSDAANLWDDAAITAPTFELDEAEAAQQPTLEVPPMSFDADETAAMSSPLTPRTTSAWDEEEDEPATVIAPMPVAAPETMPAWSTPPPVAPESLPVEHEEEQWGFDEAQLETAQRATTPAPAPIPPPVYGSAKPPQIKSGGGGRRFGLLLALLLIAILAGAGYAGFLWYQNRQDAPAEPTVVAQQTTPPPVTPAPAPADTGTIVDVPTATETTATVATTVTDPPPAQPMTVTATAAPVLPAPTTTTTTAAPAGVQPLPVVTPKANGRARYDEIARNYLANPQGNFTVQIQILCDPANLEKAMRAGGGKVWFVPQTIGGRACFRVFYGNFATRAEAQSAMASVPATLRDPSAAVKPVPRQ